MKINCFVVYSLISAQIQLTPFSFVYTLMNTFRALKSPNYRLYMGGQSISLIGTWMQRTAVSWIVFSLTHSTFMLGLTLFAGQFPTFVLSLFGGVISDRYDRYKVLLTTQIASLVQATALTVLILTNHYQIWEIIALSIVLGVINAFDVPARQSLVYQMVDNKDDLPNALALNSSMVNFSRIIGPAVAGLVLEKFGNGICFGINAFSFLAVIISLLSMKLPAYKPAVHVKNILGDLREGISYLKNTPSISFIIIMLGLISILVLPFNTLIPVYAKVIFKGTASTFGIIDALVGFGAFTAAMFLASLKSAKNLRVILAINTLVFGIGLVLFSYERVYPLALLFAAITGFGMMSQITISNTIIQTTVEPSMRGRVISFYAMAFFGMMPLGSLLVGFISRWAGVPRTVLFEGIIALIIGLVHFYYLYKEKSVKKAESPFTTASENEFLYEQIKSTEN